MIGQAQTLMAIGIIEIHELAKATVRRGHNGQLLLVLEARQLLAPRLQVEVQGLRQVRLSQGSSQIFFLGGIDMLLTGHDQVIAHQLVKLALGDAGQGRGNAQAREE